MIKLYGPDDKEMLVISTLDNDAQGKALIIKGKLYGAMPLTAVLYPEDARAFLKMLTPRLAWFLFALLFKPAGKNRK